MSLFEFVLSINKFQRLMVEVEDELLRNEIVTPMPNSSHIYIELLVVCCVILAQI
jgi:hypothetical protein